MLPRELSPQALYQYIKNQNSTYSMWPRHPPQTNPLTSPPSPLTPARENTHDKYTHSGSVSPYLAAESVRKLGGVLLVRDGHNLARSAAEQPVLYQPLHLRRVPRRDQVHLRGKPRLTIPGEGGGGGQEHSGCRQSASRGGNNIDTRHALKTQYARGHTRTRVKRSSSTCETTAPRVVKK